MARLIELSKNENINELKLDFGGFIETINIQEELAFDNSNLDNAIMEHCQRLSVLHSFAEDYQFKLDKQKLILQKLEAEKWNYIKDNEKDSSGKQYSDTRVNNLVDDDEDIFKLKIEIAETSHALRKLKYFIGLFDSKEKLMQTYSSNLRVK